MNRRTTHSFTIYERRAARRPLFLAMLVVDLISVSWLLGTVANCFII